MVLMFAADGSLVTPVILIYKGEGKRIAAEEEQVYQALPLVKVLWQKKAWIDQYVEKKVLRLQLKPYVARTQELLGYKAEFLLVQDRGPGHDNVYDLPAIFCPLPPPQ